jgi:prepilin-type N-terminal cleavage/methylation domain-containing protein
MQSIFLPQGFPSGRVLGRNESRAAYTLIELLIVISILALLLTMTVMAVNFSRDGDRVTGAASQIQSFLSGARDRAIYAKAPRGVRFFLDPNNPRAVSSMVYIDPAETWSEGVIQLRRWDPDGNGLTNLLPNNPDINDDGVADNPTQIWMVAGEGTAWWELKRRGLLFDGMRIRIPKGPQGSWYPINTKLIDVSVAPTSLQALVLSIPYRDPGDTSKEKALAFDSGGPEDYEIELPPRILPMEPVVLPEGTVIDLDGSKLPDAWRPTVAGLNGGSGNLLYSQYMDIVYSQRGTVVGTAATGGVIHFYVCDNEESLLLKEEYIAVELEGNQGLTPAAAINAFNARVRSPGTAFIPSDQLDSASATWSVNIAPAPDPYPVKDRRIVSVFSQTGGVSVHPVNAIDNQNNSNGAAGADGFADDPYYYAETGESAK